jgi:putative spermidine/putrescine transport system ATP-binding protein
VSTDGRDDGGVRLLDLQRAYGDVRALDGLTLEVAAGELVSLLGPSGCGKTTALRVLAGLETVDSGAVVVAGRDITALPANKRDMGMVFQAYSLFPHLSVLDNVAFGLRLRGVSARERRARAAEMLDLVGLAETARRYPHQLSGGQQQRVALARALVIRPSVLLLDEPLSALDAKVRVQLREEIRRLQTELGTTTLFVTHDQEEALAISDRVGVMSRGRLEQVDTPARVYQEPATAFVAEFVGVTTALAGTARDGGLEVAGRWLAVDAVGGLAHGTPARVLVRPSDFRLGPDAEGGPGLPGRVAGQSFLGPVTRLTVVPDSGDDVRARVDLPSSDAVRFPVGERVRLDVDRAAPRLALMEPAAGAPA